MVIERTWPWGLPPPGLRSSRTALWLSAYLTRMIIAHFAADRMVQCTIHVAGNVAAGSLQWMTAKACKKLFLASR